MAEITATVRPTREEVVPSRKRVKLPAWLEVAKPRLIPLLLATLAQRLMGHGSMRWCIS